MNILITSASRKVGLVKSFKKVLNSSDKVIAADINKCSPALYFADDFLKLPRSDNSNFIKILLDICEKSAIDLIIPTRDEELSLFSKNIDLFSDIGTKIMVSSLKSIEICQNKNKFIDFCINKNFTIPKTFNKFNEISEDNLPIFLKPKQGKGGAGIHKISSLHQLKLFEDDFNDYIVQEFIDMPEYTIDLFADFNGNIISAVPRERINVWGGESLVTKTFKNDFLINEVVKLAKSLNLIGHNTIQCFFDGKENIKFIEINPRFGGAASLSFAAGANSPLFIIKLLKNEEVKSIIGDFEDNLIALRYVEDFFIGENDLK